MNELADSGGRCLIEIDQAQDIVLARAQARRLAGQIGFEPADQTRLATAVSELARNILQYAGKGWCVMEDVSDGQALGIRILFEDHGPGIEDIERALQDGYSTGGGLGAGLPGTRRLMDCFDIESRPGLTRIRIAMLRPRA